MSPAALLLLPLPCPSFKNRPTTPQISPSTSRSYYELATLFYEWGWGQSFHFAYQLKGETFSTAIARHEYYLAGRLGVGQGAKVLDCGCGVGGPMRNIARFTRADITGVTLNEYQVRLDIHITIPFSSPPPSHPLPPPLTPCPLHCPPATGDPRKRADGPGGAIGLRPLGAVRLHEAHRQVQGERL